MLAHVEARFMAKEACQLAFGAGSGGTLCGPVVSLAMSRPVIKGFQKEIQDHDNLPDTLKPGTAL
jgi:hypothetical protein